MGQHHALLGKRKGVCGGSALAILETLILYDLSTVHSLLLLSTPKRNRPIIGACHEEFVIDHGYSVHAPFVGHGLWVQAVFGSLLFPRASPKDELGFFRNLPQSRCPIPGCNE